jgi:ubiquinone/menaquinone biosynthesis C-methylase UbiE
MNGHREFFNNQADRWDSFKERGEMGRIRKLFKDFKIKKGEKIADLGSGTGLLLPLLDELAGKSGEIWAVDYSQKMLSRAEEKYGPKFNYLLCSVEDMPLEKGYFDWAIAYSCFPHFSDKQKALKEISRILKPGGKLLIAHSSSREKINNMHKNIGGAVKHHMIPPLSVMKKLLDRAEFINCEIKDLKDSYLASAEKIK